MNKHKKTKHRWIRNRIIICFVIFLIIIIRWMQGLSSYLEPRLQATAKQYISTSINDVAQQVLKDLDYDTESLIHIIYGENKEITTIQYDSAKLNEILYTTLESIENNEDLKQHPNIHSSVQNIINASFDCPIGYFTRIPLLADKGFILSFPMQILSDVTGEITFDTNPYGLNSTKVQANMKITIRSQVITLLHVTEMEMVNEIPIIMQIVHGEVPQMVPYSVK